MMMIITMTTMPIMMENDKDNDIYHIHDYNNIYDYADDSNYDEDKK